MKINFNKIQIVITVLLFFSITASAQKPYAYAGKSGIFIFLGNKIPKGFVYQLERKKSENTNWEIIQTMNFPNNDFSMMELIFQNQPKYYFAERLDTNQIFDLYGKSVNLTFTDSLTPYASLPNALEAIGNGYLDNSVMQNSNYDYRILKLHDNASIENVAELKNIKAVTKKLRAKAKSISTFSDGNRIEIKFSISGADKINGGIIKRCVFAQSDLMPISTKIVYQKNSNEVKAIMIDEAVKENRTYQYVFIPADAFGNEGTPSDTVTVLNKNETNSNAKLISLKTKSDAAKNQIHLAWKLSNHKNIQSIEILRGNNFNGPFKKLTSVKGNDTSYNDFQVMPVTGYYYKLAFSSVNKIDTASATVYGMLEANKTYKVVPPTLFEPVMKSNKVKLHWQNTDPTTKSFVVYRSSALHGKMNQLEEILFNPKDTNTLQFTDTTIYTTGVYRYGVTAVSRNYTQSIMADTQVVNFILKNSVQVPLGLDVTILHNHPVLIWENMRRVDNENRGYKLYRKDESGKDESVATIIAPNQNNFTDMNAKPGKNYQYTVTAIGLNGTESKPSLPISVKLNKESLPSPASLTAIANENSVTLHWDKITLKECEGYKIFMQQGDAEWKEITKLGNDKSEYQVSNCKSAIVYSFTITAIYTGNIESENSNEAEAFIK